MTIFDWDDTLFPTSAFSPKTQDEMMKIKAQNRELFMEIDQIVSNLLEKVVSSNENSQVLIVTNAHKSWVEYSSQTLMPLTAEILKDRIRVISARVDITEGM